MIRNNDYAGSPRKCTVLLFTTTVLSFGIWYNFFEPFGDWTISFENGSLRDLYRIPLSPTDWDQWTPFTKEMVWNLTTWYE